MSESLTQPLDCVLESRVPCSGVIYQNLLMELRAPCKQRSDQLSANAAADVAHEIDDHRDRVVFVRWNSNVRHQRNWYEEEAQANHLRHAQPHSTCEADLQIKALGGIKHSDGQAQPPESDQISRLNFGR